MGKIFYIFGKSSTGKDTIYKSLMENKELGLRPVVPYTTRPMRAKETPGVEYHFTDEEELSRLQAAGKVIELRAYETVHGIWKYFTVDGKHMDLANYNYAMVGVLDSFLAIREYYGADKVIPIYIEVEDGPWTGSGARKSPSMRRCAGDFLRTALTLQRRSCWGQALCADFLIRT